MVVAEFKYFSPARYIYDLWGERSVAGSHRSQHGGRIRSLVANHITEFKVLLSDLLGNGEVNKAAN